MERGSGKLSYIGMQFALLPRLDIGYDPLAFIGYISLPSKVLLHLLDNFILSPIFKESMD